MTSKLICPFCRRALARHSVQSQEYAVCRGENCPSKRVFLPIEIWQTLIQSLKDRKELAIKLAQTNQSLEQSEKCCSAWETQALDYKAETIALSGKLEIATKALEEIKKVCDGCRWCDSNLYDPTPSDSRRIAEITHKALEQIEYKEI